MNFAYGHDLGGTDNEDEGIEEDRDPLSTTEDEDAEDYDADDED